MRFANIWSTKNIEKNFRKMELDVINIVNKQRKDFEKKGKTLNNKKWSIINSCAAK